MEPGVKGETSSPVARSPSTAGSPARRASQPAIAATRRTKPISKIAGAVVSTSDSLARDERILRRSAHLPRGLAAGAHLGVEPAGQQLALLDRLPDAVFCLDGMQPGTGLPVPACHEPFAAQEVAARMIGGGSGGDAAGARLGHLVAVLDQGGDDPGELFAALSTHGITEASELIGRHFVRADCDVQPAVRNLGENAAGPVAGAHAPRRP